MQFPKRIATHITETASFKIFSKIIPDEWIIREITERDYGIDCYIEICENGFVTGKMLSVQLKAEKEILIHRDNDEEYVAYYDIKASSLNYWYNLPVVTLFLFIDIDNEIIYFQNIRKFVRTYYEKFINENLKSIKINSKQILNKNSVVSHINNIYALEMNRQYFEHSVESFIYNFDQYVDMCDTHWCRDCFLSLDEEGLDDIIIMNIHKISKYFSSCFNITWNIKSIEDMIEEGQKMFGTHGDLFEKQVAEFVQLVLPIMNRIIDELIDLITYKERDYWTRNNNTLWRVIKTKDIKRRINGLIKYLGERPIF
jgi:hypothetical protein